MSGEKITTIVVIAAAAILGAFDIAAAAIFGKASTISVVITKYSHSWPAIPFGFGFLMGHFFAQDSDS